MRVDDIRAIDLNLLVVLDAVLSERSATRAAKRLHVTQSAVSNALRRLREIFDDPLVVRRPHGFAPTARAVALAPALRTWIDGAAALLRGDDAFRPETTTRRFVIACADAIAFTLLGRLLAGLRRTMPRAELRLDTLERLIATDGLARGDIDLLVGLPPTLPAGCRGEPLFADPMCCIVRRGHPRVRRRLSLAAYAELPHVDLALFGEPDRIVDRALARHDRTRRVAVAVPHFASIPIAVAASDAVATVSRRLAVRFAESYPLQVLHAPVELPVLAFQTIWHARTDADPGVILLRSLVREAAVEPRS